MPNLEDTAGVWQQFLEHVGPKVSEHVLENWLRPVHCQQLTDETIALEVADQFSCDWLKDHYLEFIRDNLSEILATSIQLEWHVNPDRKRSNSNPHAAGAATDPLPPVGLVPQTTVATPKFGHSQVVRPLLPSRPLNTRYQFCNFVTGPSNQLAYAGAQAVAHNPGKSYNPLFIFGGVGLGKTHLLSAIGHHISSHNPQSRCLYTTSEQFSSEVINAVLTNKLEAFRNRYFSGCDVILLDDIQLIAGKDRTQHEFFQIFNSLYDSERQIVLTSDKLPHEIPEIEERLRNRFQWGLIADVQPPETETKVAILHQKARASGYFLPDAVAFFLAEAIPQNVRELEGALVRLLAHASLTQQSISVEYAKNILADVLAIPQFDLDVELIQKVVATYFGVRVADIKSKKRHKTFVRARQIAIYLCRKYLHLSLNDIGSYFGDKDHSTVLSACARIEKLARQDAEVTEQVNFITQLLKNPSPYIQPAPKAATLKPAMSA